MTETVDAPVVPTSMPRIHVVELERLAIALQTVDGLGVATPADRRPGERG
jgi:alkyl hydroperoxide reductase subunit AhpC